LIIHPNYYPESILVYRIMLALLYVDNYYTMNMEIRLLLTECIDRKIETIPGKIDNKMATYDMNYPVNYNYLANDDTPITMG